MDNVARLAAAAYLDAAAAGAVCRAGGAQRFAWFDRNGTQGFLSADDNLAVLSFRGTEARLEDVLTDARIRRTEMDSADGATAVAVHRGFLRAWRAVRGPAIQAIDRLPAGCRLVVTGHSLGAAIALVATRDLVIHGRAVSEARLYGCPRVGNAAFAAWCRAAASERGVAIRRFVNCADIVPRVPPWACGYRHAGQLYYYDRQGRLHVDPPMIYRLLDMSLGLAGTAVDVLSDGVQASDFLAVMRSRLLSDHRADEYVRLGSSVAPAE